MCAGVAPYPHPFPQQQKRMKPKFAVKLKSVFYDMFFQYVYAPLTFDLDLVFMLTTQPLQTV